MPELSPDIILAAYNLNRYPEVAEYCREISERIRRKMDEIVQSALATGTDPGTLRQKRVSLNRGEGWNVPERIGPYTLPPRAVERIRDYADSMVRFWWNKTLETIDGTASTGNHAPDRTLADIAIFPIRPTDTPPEGIRIPEDNHLQRRT